MKHILLIGGSHGIGNHIAALHANDHKVFIASRSQEQLPKGTTHIPFDVLNDNIEDAYLPEDLDGFVYCPGSINLKPFRMLFEDSFKADMDINFFGMVRVLKHILPKMNVGGSIVLFSTVAVQTGMPFHTSVAAAKGAIEGFARSLAAENAPKLRVNVIAPSLVDTPLARRLLNNDAKREKMGERHPLKRVGKPNDIAKAASYLLSDDSSWITGQVLGVDGGLSSLNLS